MQSLNSKEIQEEKQELKNSNNIKNLWNKLLKNIVYYFLRG
jgi:hypothetical protein